MSTAVSLLLTSSGTSATNTLSGEYSAESAISTLVAWPLIMTGLAVTTSTRTTSRPTAKAALYRGWAGSLSVS